MLDPEVLSQANTVLSYLDGLTNEPTRPFVEGACWPDQIKDEGVEEYNEWHFTDVPIFEDGKMPVKTDPVNSSWATHQLYSTLKETETTTNGKLMQSFGLRMMIHIVGDIHQPLHSAALFSDRFPTGDEGGNLFKI